MNSIPISCNVAGTVNLFFLKMNEDPSAMVNFLVHAVEPVRCAFKSARSMNTDVHSFLKECGFRTNLPWGKSIASRKSK